MDDTRRFPEMKIPVLVGDERNGDGRDLEERALDRS